MTFSSDGSSDSDGTIVSYAWAFGDGTSGTGSGPTHVYTTAGTYNAVLTVTDDDAATATAAQIISVTAPPPPAGTVTLELSATKDTFVVGDQSRHQLRRGYGPRRARLSRGPRKTAWRISQFDLGPIPADVTIESAVLHLAPVQGNAPAVTVKVHAVADPWEEMAMTWNNRPTPGALLGTIPMVGANLYHQLDLTAHVQALYTAGAALNLALLDDTTANLLVKFSSRQGDHEPAKTGRHLCGRRHH